MLITLKNVSPLYKKGSSTIQNQILFNSVPKMQIFAPNNIKFLTFTWIYFLQLKVKLSNFVSTGWSVQKGQKKLLLLLGQQQQELTKKEEELRFL